MAQRRAPQTRDDMFATLNGKAANSKLVDGDCGGLASRYLLASSDISE